ncbi:hypothetical protein Y032_0044g1020 [Ancylostoma ceylanicum]|uniref:Uncharacterized protein n=1 Tax=Ancylostoma ceylanicum TaxID=53326 RepID=A0A016UE34_9BILA|nr:hypothetical protein Y032_0044g1020 [Ancylostoma ceylanicum]
MPDHCSCSLVFATQAVVDQRRGSFPSPAPRFNNDVFIDQRPSRICPQDDVGAIHICFFRCICSCTRNPLIL